MASKMYVLAHDWVLDMTEFQAHKAAAFLQNTMSFLDYSVNVSTVANTESNGVDVD
jgi:hypothetical protein